MTITVGPPPSASLSAATTTVAYGGTATISWGSQNVTTCTAPSGNWSNQGTLSGSGLTNPLFTTTTFTFQCSNNNGQSSSVASVTVVVGSAPSASLSAATTTVAYGGTATISWGSQNVTTCTAPSGNWSNQGTLSGSGLTNPLFTTTTFTFQCSNNNGQSSSVASVTVVVGSAPSASLSAATTTVAYGGTATISWGSQNVTTCTAPSGNWSNQGTLSGSGLTNPLFTTTTFTFQCSNNNGQSSSVASVTVVVGSAPSASLSAATTTVAYGGTATISWGSQNVTTCTAPSGNWSNQGTLSGSGLTNPLFTTTTFTFQCSNNNGQSSSVASVTVVVGSAPSASLSAATTTVAYGGAGGLSRGDHKMSQLVPRRVETGQTKELFLATVFQSTFHHHHIHLPVFKQQRSII